MGVSFIPDLALMSVRDDIVVRSLGARAPARHIAAATLKGSYKSPAKQAMIDVLVEIGQEFSAGPRGAVTRFLTLPVRMSAERHRSFDI